MQIEFQYVENTEQIPSTQTAEDETYRVPAFIIDAHYQASFISSRDDNATGVMCFDRDTFEMQLKGENIHPGLAYKMTLANGEEIEGELDENNKIFHKDIAPGPVDIEMLPESTEA